MYPPPPRPPPYQPPMHRPQSYYPTVRPPPGMRAYVTPQGLIFYLSESATQLSRIRVPTPDDELYPVATDAPAAAPAAQDAPASETKAIPWLALLALAGGLYLLAGRGKK